MSESARALALTVLVSALFFAEAALVGAADNGSSLPIDVTRGGETRSGRAKVTVRRGDHLWSISANHLADIAGQPVPNSVVSNYWRVVITANRDRLESGDPDLIFPGEIVVLPEPRSGD